MSKAFLILSSCLVSLIGKSTGELVMNPPVAEVDKKIQGLDLMPAGSLLKGVSLPKYVNHKLSLLVTSPQMKVESHSEISGEDVMTYIYDEQGIETSRFFLKHASYFLNTSILSSNKTVILKDFRFDLIGTGLVFDNNNKTGYVKGPGKMIIHESLKHLSK